MQIVGIVGAGIYKQIFEERETQFRPLSPPPKHYFIGVCVESSCEVQRRGDGTPTTQSPGTDPATIAMYATAAGLVLVLVLTGGLAKARRERASSKSTWELGLSGIGIY